jgi:TonB family protein
MSESNTHIDLFTKSGCLTTEALKRYHSDKLSDFEKHQVKGHLVSCELCSDALEGLQLLSDPKMFDSIVSEINENFKNTLTDVERTQSKKFKLQNRLYYIAAAASVLILLGLFSYLKTYLNSESATQTISQLVDIEKKSIPPMPSVKTQEIIPKSEEQSQLVHKKGKPLQKETSNELIDKTETTHKIETNQSAQKVTDEENLMYVAPLKAIRSPESIHESLAFKEIDTDVDRISESEEYIAIDIASTQPLEYYIGGVVVYDKADEHAEPTAYSTGAGIMSGRASNQKKMNAIPQMVASESKKGKHDEKQKDLIAQEQSDFEYEEEWPGENHFFSLGNEVPQYPGGYEALIEFLNSNLTYPKEARQQGLQGKVVISFIIEENGEVSSVTIVHGIGGGCDEEAVRVIELMPAWLPAYKESNPVRVLFNMPITFRLN